jgi:hypothetical protein
MEISYLDFNGHMSWGLENHFIKIYRDGQKING